MRHVFFAVCAASGVVWSSSLPAGESAEGPKFGKLVPTDAIQFAVSNSNDGKVSTMIFDNLMIATELGRPVEPDVVTKSFTFVRRIESDSDACVEMDFRGFVSRSGTGSASLVIHSGGETTVVDLKQAIDDAKRNATVIESPVREQAAAVATERGFDDPVIVDEADDYFVRVCRKVPKGKSLQTTIFLLVDRTKGDEESAAHLTVDTIDLELTAVPETK